MISWFYRHKMPSLLNLSGVDRVKATLIFRQANYSRILNWFLKDGYSHVLIVVHKPNADVLIDPRIGYTEVTVYPPNTDFSDLGEKITVNVETQVGRLRGIFGLLNCVEQVKAFLGIRDKFIFTPYQLYRKLKNGKRLFKTKGSGL